MNFLLDLTQSLTYFSFHLFLAPTRAQSFFASSVCLSDSGLFEGSQVDIAESYCRSLKYCVLFTPTVTLVPWCFSLNVPRVHLIDKKPFSTKSHLAGFGDWLIPFRNQDIQIQMECEGEKLFSKHVIRRWLLKDISIRKKLTFIRSLDRSDTEALQIPIRVINPENPLLSYRSRYIILDHYCLAYLQQSESTMIKA